MLLLALRRRLFLALEQAGLRGPRVEDVATDDVEPEKLASLYHFSDSRANQRLALTVHVKSFRRPTFEIIAGRVPAAGVKLFCPEETIPADRVTADMLQEQAILRSAPRQSYAPFRQPLWAHILGTRHGIEECVVHAVRLLPLLLAWLADGTPSKYVRVIRPPRPQESPKSVPERA